MRINSHRLSLLTAKEIDDLYGIPHFTEADRHHYFALSVSERTAVDAHTTSVAVHLTLQLGYFKVKWQFFHYEQDAVSVDLRSILARYFPGKVFADITIPSRPTRLALQQIVLQLFDYHLCDNAAKDELERKAQRNARLSTQPIYLLREALGSVRRRYGNQSPDGVTYPFLHMGDSTEKGHAWNSILISIKQQFPEAPEAQY